MHFDFNVDDFDKAIAQMKQMADQNVVDGAVLAGLREGGRMVQEAAKNLCPVNEGQLYNSIMPKDIPDQVGVDIGTAEQGIYVEYGTGPLGDPAVNHTSKDKWFAPSVEVDPDNGIDKRTADTYHFVPVNTKGGLYYIVHPQAPQPFLYPALEANKENIANEVKKAVGRVMK